MGKGKVFSVIVTLLLLLAVGYIGFNFYEQDKQQKEADTFQQGAQYGFEQAILSVTQQAATCQQVPLIVGNQTVNMIAINCLQQ
jgi:predicted Na+-dependent transporter|tara:strand:+ start:256 stop:507 length:252 start_codon:yes stop_codon:yes gene_type:complete